MIFVGNIYAGLNSGGGGGGVTTLDNGLTLTGTNGQLGGPLVQDTDVDTTGFDLTIGEPSTNLGMFIDHLGRGVQLNGLDSLGTTGSFGEFAQGVLLIEVVTPTGEVGFTLSPAGSFIITNSITDIWAAYAADYSVASLGNPRSIPDLGAVEALIAAFSPSVNNGLSVVGGNIGVGGTLIRNSTIDVTGFFLELIGSNSFFQFSNSAGTLNGNDGAGNSCEVSVDFANFAQLLYTAASSATTSFSATSAGLAVHDNNSHIGFVADTDFSANVLGNNLAYPQAILATLRPAKSINVAVIASGQLLTYANPADGFYRVSFTICVTAGIGVMAVSLVYTDLNGTLQTATVASQTGVGNSSNAPLSILSKGGTSITLNAIVTGTVTATIGCCIELLN